MKKILFLLLKKLKNTESAQLWWADSTSKSFLHQKSQVDDDSSLTNTKSSQKFRQRVTDVATFSACAAPPTCGRTCGTRGTGRCRGRASGGPASGRPAGPREIKNLNKIWIFLYKFTLQFNQLSVDTLIKIKILLCAPKHLLPTYKKFFFHIYRF